MKVTSMSCAQSLPQSRKIIAAGKFGNLVKSVRPRKKIFIVKRCEIGHTRLLPRLCHLAGLHHRQAHMKLRGESPV